MMDIIEKARAFAAGKHASQKRKYTDQPYFNHLEAVASTLQSAGVMEPTVLAAAYLHDTVEDTDDPATSSAILARTFVNWSTG